MRYEVTRIADRATDLYLTFATTHADSTGRLVAPSSLTAFRSTSQSFERLKIGRLLMSKWWLTAPSRELFPVIAATWNARSYLYIR